MGDRIEIPAALPRWRNRALYALGWAVLRTFGWRVDARLPNESKLIVIAAPHTSNWDFVFGMAAILRIQVRVNFIGKHTLFTGWRGRFFRALGGIPVDRDAPGGIVQDTVAAFRASERLVIALAPEGTRARRAQWKRGFHRIAHEAGVPVLVAYIDYARKCVGTAQLMRTTGDWDADMQPVFAFYRGVRARYPQDFAVEDAATDR
ncbi:MAG TPA: 1-acyl-sn-glycerol-3-phosphate acyltransferase [Solimonas sp.]